MLGGLLEWLTGSLGPMGIVMPKDIFSLSGIFNLVLQVLGLGWDYIRVKTVKMMGEPTVKALEGGYDMFKTFATKGIDGIWEFLKDKFTDLKEAASIAELTEGEGKCEMCARKITEAIGGDIIKIKDKLGALGIGAAYNKKGELISNTFVEL